MPGILSGIPSGVSVRRLDTKRKAPKQGKPYKFSAWKGAKLAYGNSIRSAVRNLGLDVEAQITK